MTTKEAQKAASARWYAKNKYKLSEKRKGKRKEEHKASYAYLIEKYGHEELNRKSKEWRAKNLEKARLSCTNSRKNNPERNILNKARHSAKSRGLEFNLEIEDIIIPSTCIYFKQPLDVWGNPDFVPSIDRIENSKGYVKGNIQIISYLANKMKHTATQEQLRTFALSILERPD